MARIREFDAEDALEKAMHLFWENGYSSTSVRDISSHTGVAHAGLYAEFKGKDGLFEAALRHYALTRNNLIFGPLEQPSAGKEELHVFLQTLVQAAKDKSFKNGCFIANTASEFAGKDGPVSAFVKSHFKRQIAAIENALRNAQDSGEIHPAGDIEEIASMLLTTFYGISSLVRAKVPSEHYERTITQAMKLLN